MFLARVEPLGVLNIGDLITLLKIILSLECAGPRHFLASSCTWSGAKFRFISKNTPGITFRVVSLLIFDFRINTTIWPFL